MKFKSKSEKKELDMTPMIDITFLLIAFFMVLINFSEADQSERIKLPASELAKPPDKPLVEPVVLQIAEDGTTIFNGRTYEIRALRDQLDLYRRLQTSMNKPMSAATVVIRADGFAQSGTVQDVIQICRDLGMQNFKLRAKQSK